MKKIYTIGRDEGCDIVIPDNTDVISRLHATIRIEAGDKIFLTDQSRNGTYINGMKMTSNVEIPVSRKRRGVICPYLQFRLVDGSQKEKQCTENYIYIVSCHCGVRCGRLFHNEN